MKSYYLIHYQTIERNSQGKKEENGGVMVPRQFLELSPGGTNRIMNNEQSGSSSEERLPSGNKRLDRDENQEPEGWEPNKAPKLSPPKPAADQPAEATMRKARVSVRARSEAPMVLLTFVSKRFLNHFSYLLTK